MGIYSTNIKENEGANIAIKETKWFWAILTILFFAVNLNACQPRPKTPSSASKTLKAPATASKAKIRLNNEDFGTTGYSSVLIDKLQEIFKNRLDNGDFKEGGNEVEKTVFICIDSSLKVSEISETVSSIQFTASPLRLANEPGKTTKNKIVKPNPLLLVVTIGDLDFDIPAETDGIDLWLELTAFKKGEGLVVPNEGTLVEILREGEYIIDGKPVAKSALRNRFEAYYKDWRDDPGLKTVTVYLENNAEEISFGSVATVARAAFDAGVKRLCLIIYKPEE